MIDGDESECCVVCARGGVVSVGYEEGACNVGEKREREREREGDCDRESAVTRTLQNE